MSPDSGRQRFEGREDFKVHKIDGEILTVAVDIPKTYEPANVENQWYALWEQRGYFQPSLDSAAESFSIVLPPPNVTGSLHMGHALNITLQDILVRWRRMQGRNVLWVPGTDHAGIATQNVVERQLAGKGERRGDVGREKFEALVWEWKEIAESNILRQIRRLGCSCDWSRKRFTLDEGLSRAVRQVFVELYRQGLVYRGEYLVNWCPRCGTAISDLEVEYQPTHGNLWHIRYPLEQGRGFVVVATTRPETMLGDTAVAVHPDDPRYADLKGKSVRLPLMNRSIPIIFDSFVETEFGSGAVKVTPGHDPNDFEAGRRHNLATIQVIGNDGFMTGEAGVYAGLDRYQAREKVVEDLKLQGLLEKVEPYSHSVGRCQRCDTVVEPLVSTQWFVKVKPLAEEAVRAVAGGETVFIPENYQRVYLEWMNKIHDWCISRQLWWGHRIPAWYCDDCGAVTVEKEDPDRCARCGRSELRQETDVLDTWFSSALWPFSTLGWPDSTRELQLFYPTSTLVTGFDIIFFWVARMMMMGLRFQGKAPFRQVYINGLVRDEKGRKMSKSRGNIIDPLGIIDEYGTDAVRFTLAIMAVPGADIPFSVSRMAGYRAFCNKIWNAVRFLLMNLEETGPVTEEEMEKLRHSESLELADRWILSRLHQTVDRINQGLERFHFHEVSNDLYHFFWHELCDWYVELAKIGLSSPQLADREKSRQVATYVMETSLRLLHPFVPFITEELWQKMPHQGETVMKAPYPEARSDWVDEQAVRQMEDLQELITAVRTARAENNLDPRSRIPAQFRPAKDSLDLLQSQKTSLQALAQLDSLEFVTEFYRTGIQVQGVARLAEFSLQLEAFLDVESEKKRLAKQLEKTQREVDSLKRRLSDPQFLKKAPAEVVETARGRHREAWEKMQKLEEKLEQF